MPGIIGKKVGMTQIFDGDGRAMAVTVIEAGPCPVLQVREGERPGTKAVQLGFGWKKPKNTTRAELGHARKAGLELAPRVLREFRLPADEAPAVGEQVTVAAFQPGMRIKVTGRTKGRGFAGVMKRHGFRGNRASHGATRIHRAPGSLGPGTDPSRVIKGKKLPGHYGDEQRTIRNLLVVHVDPERNLLFVKGSVPGPNDGVLYLSTAS